MKKKNLIASGLAVIAAASLLIGGTMAYYLGTTEGEVANTWVNEGNSISISETGPDGNETTGNTYSIIPGTSDTKDPVITAN